jgi:hypothetical protein
MEKWFLFAYDTNILVIDKGMDALQQMLKQSYKREIWFKNNLLIMAMIFHFNKIRPILRPCIVFNNSETTYTTKLRSLGLTLQKI